MGGGRVRGSGERSQGRAEARGRRGAETDAARARSASVVCFVPARVFGRAATRRAHPSGRFEISPPRVACRAFETIRGRDAPPPRRKPRGAAVSAVRDAPRSPTPTPPAPASAPTSPSLPPRTGFRAHPLRPSLPYRPLSAPPPPSLSPALPQTGRRAGFAGLSSRWRREHPRLEFPRARTRTLLALSPQRRFPRGFRAASRGRRRVPPPPRRPARPLRPAAARRSRPSRPFDPAPPGPEAAGSADARAP